LHQPGCPPHIQGVHSGWTQNTLDFLARQNVLAPAWLGCVGCCHASLIVRTYGTAFGPQQVTFSPGAATWCFVRDTHSNNAVNGQLAVQPLPGVYPVASGISGHHKFQIYGAAPGAVHQIAFGAPLHVQLETVAAPGITINTVQNSILNHADAAALELDRANRGQPSLAGISRIPAAMVPLSSSSNVMIHLEQEMQRLTLPEEKTRATIPSSPPILSPDCALGACEERDGELQKEDPGCSVNSCAGCCRFGPDPCDLPSHNEGRIQ